ncbi:MAG: RING-H2 finger protein [Methanobacteriota archaeon]|nr:MAG: RING-H2 finger protein [Euryarchaeota archaeon]
MSTERILEPMKFMEPYLDEETTEIDVEALIGLLLISKETNVKSISRTLGRKQIEVEELLGRILQSGLFKLKFDGSKVIVQEKKFKPKTSNAPLTVQDQFFLSYVKARHMLSLKELAEVFEARVSEIQKKIAIFAARGLIEIIHQDGDSYFFIVKYLREKKTPETISVMDIMIIGYLMVKGVTTIEEISLDLDVPTHRVQSVLVDLLLSETIICVFEYQKNFLRENSLTLKIRQVNITFPTKEISALNEHQRTLIGLVGLAQKISMDKLTTITGLSRTRIMELLCTLTVMTTYRFIMDFEEDVMLEEPPIFYPARSLEEMEDLNFFNYRELLGRISTSKKIRLSQLSRKMKIPKDELYLRLIDLYVEGHLKGRLISTDEFVVETIRKSETSQVETLSSEEKIILGGLIASKRLTWPEIGVLLKIDREQSITLAYSMVAKNIGVMEIRNEKELFLLQEPSLPPLVTVEELSFEDQVLLGYMASATNPNLKEAKAILRKPRVHLLSHTYLLIGSGLLVAKQLKQRFNVHRIRIEQPKSSIETKSFIVQKVAKILDQNVGSKVSLKKIAKEMGEEPRVIFQTALFLVAQGYIVGKLRGNDFIVTRSFVKFKVDHYCYFCNSKIENKDEPCPVCENAPINCSVCRGFISATDDVLKCPTCQNLAHPEHLEEWLRMKGECPICKMKLRATQFIRIEAPLKI